MDTQDELVALFRQHLSLQPMPMFNSSCEEVKSEEPIVYSISQHYHHSAHIVSPPAPAPAFEPLGTDTHLAELLLSQYGVDLHSLHPSQVKLFRTADVDQKRRLIELWQICSPGHGRIAADSDVWFERQRQTLRKQVFSVQGDHSTDSDDMSSDTSRVAPPECISSDDEPWDQTHTADPYMTSGYEIRTTHENDSIPHSNIMRALSQYTPATDPVYNKPVNLGGDWTALISQRQQLMGIQPSVLDQCRPHLLESAFVCDLEVEDEEML